MSATAVPLSQSNFTFLGSYVINGGGYAVGATTYSPCFGKGNISARYVAGQLRLFVFTDLGLLEFPLPANTWNAANNGTILQPSQAWADPYDGTWMDPPTNSIAMNQNFGGCTWDEANQRIFMMGVIQYPGPAASTLMGIQTTKLNNDGTVASHKGPWQINGHNRQTWGCVLNVPAWFQTQYGVPKYAAGLGGLPCSILTNGPISLGEVLFSFPELETFAANTFVGAGTTLVSFGNNNIETSFFDWWTADYPGYRNPNFTLTYPLPDQGDRGARAQAGVINDIDYAGAVPAGSPPPPAGYWSNTAPDGAYRIFPGGDSLWGAAVWIDGAHTHGVLTVASLATGLDVYGPGNFPQFPSRIYEFRVWDPADLGKVALGTKQPWAIQPKNRWLDVNVYNAGSGPGVTVGDNNLWSVRGAHFDTTTKLLYVYAVATSFVRDSNHPDGSVYVYSVNDSLALGMAGG